MALNSQDTYASRLSSFDSWAEAQIPHYDPKVHVTAEVVSAWLVAYLVDEQRKVASAQVTLAALRWRSLINDPSTYAPTDHPLVQGVLVAAKRGLPAEQLAKKKARAISLAELRQLVDAVDTVPTAGEHHEVKVSFWRAYLMIAFLSGMRRSELVRMQISWVTFLDEGVEIHVPQSKTDQAGKGHTIRIPLGSDDYCAVAALRKWVILRNVSFGTEAGSVFPSGVALSRVRFADDLAAFFGTPTTRAEQALVRRRGESRNQQLKTLARAAGLSDEVCTGLTHHSTRRGLATSLRRAGTEMGEISKVLGHTSLDSTAGYVDVVDGFADHPLGALEL